MTIERCDTVSSHRIYPVESYLIPLGTLGKLHRMKRILLALLSAAQLLLPFNACAQSLPPSGSDLQQGLWWLYHLRYEKAVALYDQHIARDPEDPAGYFYKAAADWWHLAQEFEYEQPDIQKRFDESVDLTIAKAKARLKRLDEKNPQQAKEIASIYLYWGGAEGLRGRWLVTQKHWVKAYFSGRAGFLKLKKAVRLDPSQYDAYMGIGIYDYFSDTLSGVVGALSAILVRGDRKRGIATLEQATLRSEHARVEAMIFLAEIYTFEEKQPEKALPLLRQLRQEYPDSPLMHLAEITTLFQMKQWDAVARESQIFLEKSQDETPYYVKTGVAPALYCLGISEWWGQHDPARALKRFEQILANTPKQDPNRWISFALLRRAQIRDLKGQRAEALEDYRAVLARPNLWGTHREANTYVKTPYPPSSPESL